MANTKKWRRSPLPAVPEVITNTFCNWCLRLPNFDLLIITLSVKTFLAVSYWFTTDPYAVAFIRFHSLTLTPSTLAVGHWWWLAKDICPACCFQFVDCIALRRSSWSVLWTLFLVLVITWLALTLYTLSFSHFTMSCKYLSSYFSDSLRNVTV